MSKGKTNKSSFPDVHGISNSCESDEAFLAKYRAAMKEHNASTSDQWSARYNAAFDNLVSNINAEHEKVAALVKKQNDAREKSLKESKDDYYARWREESDKRYDAECRARDAEHGAGSADSLKKFMGTGAAIGVLTCVFPPLGLVAALGGGAYVLTKIKRGG